MGLQRCCSHSHGSERRRLSSDYAEISSITIINIDRDVYEYPPVGMELVARVVPVRMCWLGLTKPAIILVVGKGVYDIGLLEDIRFERLYRLNSNYSNLLFGSQWNSCGKC